MALPQSYLTSVKNLPGIMEAIQGAGVPDKFTFEFLKTLGYSSSSDRPIIPVLKSLDFLDSSGTPTKLYRAYKDKTTARKVLGKAIRSAYEDIFLANENAQILSNEKVKGIIASITGKGETVVEKMATTFKSLCALADFSEDTDAEVVEESIHVEEKDNKGIEKVVVPNNPTFHYNIQIHLPITKDISVYNAIFKSIKEHLL